MQELRAIYPDFTDLINSTAAARLNAYLDGYGSYQALQSEIDEFGLSVKSQKKLLKMAERLKYSESGAFCKPF